AAAAAAVLAALPATLASAGPGADSAPLVRVRVEGKTRTLFGPTEPRAQAATPLQALEKASLAGEIYYHVQETSFGPYVDQIGRYRASGTSGWVFKVNGAMPPVGADKVELKPGDRVLWYWATFSESGGPPTLRLARVKPDCYQVTAEDDQGKTTPVAATLRVDGQALSVKAGATTCVPRPHGLVRAVAPGAVRSNALP
ncbi:MAG: hypothetical protein C4307_04000, partial [Chloroflexota bacterium]